MMVRRPVAGMPGIAAEVPYELIWLRGMLDDGLVQSDASADRSAPSLQNAGYPNHIYCGALTDRLLTKNHKLQPRRRSFAAFNMILPLLPQNI